MAPFLFDIFCQYFLNHELLFYVFISLLYPLLVMSLFCLIYCPPQQHLDMILQIRYIN